MRAGKFAIGRLYGRSRSRMNPVDARETPSNSEDDDQTEIPVDLQRSTLEATLSLLGHQGAANELDQLFLAVPECGGTSGGAGDRT